MYAWRATCGRVAERQHLRRLDCMHRVPILPVEAPMIADGLRAHEFEPHGRDAQSMAFLSAPGDRRGCTPARRTARVDAGERLLERPPSGG